MTTAKRKRKKSKLQTIYKKEKLTEHFNHYQFQAPYQVQKLRLTFEISSKFYKI